MGAFCFQWIESQPSPHKVQNTELQSRLSQNLEQLKNLSLQQKGNKEFNQKLLTAYNLWFQMQTSSTKKLTKESQVFELLPDQNATVSEEWTFGYAFLFTFSIVTTIGRVDLFNTV